MAQDSSDESAALWAKVFEMKKQDLDYIWFNLMDKSFALLSTVEDIVDRGRTVCQEQNSIKDMKDFLRKYPESFNQVHNLLELVLKTTNDFELSRIRADQASICRLSVPRPKVGTKQEVSKTLSASIQNASPGLSKYSDNSTSAQARRSSSFEKNNSEIPSTSLGEGGMVCIKFPWDNYNKGSHFKATFLRFENSFPFFTSLWLRRQTDDDISKLLENLELQNSTKFLYNHMSPAVGQIVLGKTPRIFRGCVLSVTDFGFELVDIDRGEIVFCCAEDLYIIDEETLSFRASVFLCKLSKINHWCEEYCVILEKLFKESELFVSVTDKIPGSPPLFVLSIDAQLSSRININEFVLTNLIKKSGLLDKLKISSVPDILKTLSKSKGIFSDNSHFTNAAVGKGKKAENEHPDEAKEKSSEVSSSKNFPMYDISEITENCAYEMVFIDNDILASPWTFFLSLKQNQSSQSIRCTVWGLPKKCPYWSCKLSDFFRSVMSMYSFSVRVTNIVHGQPPRYIVHMTAKSDGISFDVSKWMVFHIVPLLCRLADANESKIDILLMHLDPAFIFEESK